MGLAHMHLLLARNGEILQSGETAARVAFQKQMSSGNLLASLASSLFAC